MEEFVVRLLDGFSGIINRLSDLISAYPWIGNAFPFLPALPALLYRAIFASVVIAVFGFVSLLLMATKGHVGLLMWLALWVISFAVGISKSQRRKLALGQRNVTSA
jgi:hypothetical protein